MKKGSGGPGKSFRTGMTFIQLMDEFPTNRVAEDWFVGVRWKDGVRCPFCESDNIYTRPEDKRRNQPYRCRPCRKDFSAKTGTLLQSSNLGFRVWVIATYLVATNLKGVSSIKLHRDLGITQKTAWLLTHKIRETFVDNAPALFGGQVEVDESYFGGLEKNKHKHKRLNAGTGTVGKTAVIGVRECDSNKIKAQKIDNTRRETLHGFIRGTVSKGATINTDDLPAYRKLDGYKHEVVKHSVGEYVDGMAHTNGLESFWSMMKRGYHGTYHHLSAKHLGRYVNEFAGRHNIRPLDTIQQMAFIARGLVGKRLIYDDLVA